MVLNPLNAFLTNNSYAYIYQSGKQKTSAPAGIQAAF